MTINSFKLAREATHGAIKAMGGMEDYIELLGELLDAVENATADAVPMPGPDQIEGVWISQAQWEKLRRAYQRAE